MSYPKWMDHPNGSQHRARSAEEEASLKAQGYKLRPEEAKEEAHKPKLVEMEEAQEETHERKHAKHK